MREDSKKLTFGERPIFDIDLALGLADCICNACGEEFEVVVGRIRNLNTATEKIIQSSKTTIECKPDRASASRCSGGTMTD